MGYWDMAQQPLGRFSVTLNEQNNGYYEVRTHSRWTHIAQAQEVVYPNLTFEEAVDCADAVMSSWAEIRMAERIEVLRRTFHQRTIFDPEEEPDVSSDPAAQQ